MIRDSIFFYLNDIILRIPITNLLGHGLGVLDYRNFNNISITLPLLLLFFNNKQYKITDTNDYKNIYTYSLSLHCSKCIHYAHVTCYIIYYYFCSLIYTYYNIFNILYNINIEYDIKNA